MNKSRFPSNSYIGSQELRTVSDFIEVDFHKILSGLVSPGLIIKKLSGGQLDSPFKVYVSQGTKSGDSNIVKVTPGLFISSSEGVARIFELKSQDLQIGLLPNGPYNVCVVASISGYEEGRVSFTQNSDIVTISDGTFAHLRPFASIIAYEENNSKPFGAFKVIEISGNQAKLSVPYPGESKIKMKWKAGAKFPDNSEPTGDEAKVMYDFNSCEAVLSKSGEGIVLGTVNIYEESGIKKATVTSDRRGDSLAEFNNNRAYADDVLPGITNSITTIDEKAQAARVYKIVSDYFTPGVRFGGALTITNNILTVAPFIAYDSLGRRLECNTARTFTLTFTVSGKYALYAYYGGPGIVNFTWSSQDLINPGVIVGYVTFTKGIETDNNTTPDTFSATTNDIPRNSLKAGSLISSGRRTPATTELENTLWTEGEIYYNSADSLFYYVKKLSSGKLQAEKVISKTYLDQQIGALKYLERLRFTLYPFDYKNNWFLFNGICAPAPVGYEFVVVQWKIGVLDVTVFDGDINSSIDYISKIASPNWRVASDTCNWRQLVTKTKKWLDNSDLSLKKYNADAALGVYYQGTGSTRFIELKVDGEIADKVNMETQGSVQDSGGGTPKNSLYSVEVTIQLVSGVQYAIPRQDEQAA